MALGLVRAATSSTHSMTRGSFGTRPVTGMVVVKPFSVRWDMWLLPVSTSAGDRTTIGDPGGDPTAVHIRA